MRGLIVLWLVAACIGCGSAPTRVEIPAPPVSADASLDDLAGGWREHEDEVLGWLSRGDPTFGLRVGVVPTLSTPDAEVEANWLNARDRGQALEEAEIALARWDVPAKLLQGKSDRAWELRLERELVVRAVREERYRYERERELPRAASDLVRATIAAFKGAPSTDSSKAHARWITRRLDEVRASLRSGPLSAMELAELEDALDPLERDALLEVNAVIARLRVDLEAQPRAPSRAPDARAIERSVGAHLGTSFPLTVIRSRLERAEASMRDAVRAQAARMSTEEGRAAERAAEQLLFTASRCGAAGIPSQMRRALPSPERALVCASVRAVADARNDTDALAALIALHDEMSVALWAIAMGSLGMDGDTAQRSYKLMSATPPERSVRWVRLAAVRPATAIGAGLGAEMLARRGVSEAPRIARAWGAFGDAPLDIVEREVMAKLR